MTLLASLFRGNDGYHTLEAYASRIESRVEELTDSPEILSADCIEGFEVTEDMLGNYSDVMKRAFRIRVTVFSASLPASLSRSCR